MNDSSTFQWFSMISSFLQISSSFYEIHWFFHDLKAHMNFNDFSRAVGTLHMKFEIEIPKQTWLTSWKPCHLQSPETEKSNILKLTLLKINRLLPIYISIVPLKFEVDIQSQSPETKKSNMATRRPFWKWHRWKSIGFCLWPPSTCIWNLKLKFQSKLDLCSGNHVVYRQTDRRTDKVNPVYPPSNFVGRGYNDG